jgi:hypothetical protein
LNVKETVREVLYAILPILLLVSLLQVTVGRLPLAVFGQFIAGAVLVMAGLVLFLVGIKVGFLPMGEMIGSAMVSQGRLWLILLFGCLLGFVVTVAEPDVQVLSLQIDAVSGGTIDRGLMIGAIALGVGLFVALAMLRIFLRMRIALLLAVGYLLVFVLAFLAPAEYVAVSFDSGGVTTGPMTVPFILALGVGVAAVTGGRRGEGNDSFGLVALASIGPILAVLLMGIFTQ